MRNVFKLAAVAAMGVGMAMSVSAPSYATTANVTDAAKYFFDCLAKLGTDQNCGGPHEMNRSTASIGGGSNKASGDAYCPPCYHVVWEEANHNWHCEHDYKSYGRGFAKFNFAKFFNKP
jgi:hypothetical protein